MLTIDSQVHAYERNHSGRPWVSTIPGPAEVTGDQLVAAMDELGVDGALLVSPWAVYRFDPSYCVEIRKVHPGRFALVTPIDPTDPGVADTVAAWAATEGAVGIRIMLAMLSDDPADPGVNRALAAAAQYGLPVNLYCAGRLDQLGQLAARHPYTVLLIDHLGLQQPILTQAAAEPFADLPNLLALARYDNIALKISGACTLSREPFPFNDLWDPLRRMFDAFGLERCMWGTDWTRATALVSFKDSVEAFRVTDSLSDSERALLMGETLARIYRWAPSTA
jgi:predicted TIM-barrel fold metal-dependent hydrolase